MNKYVARVCLLAIATCAAYAAFAGSAGASFLQQQRAQRAVYILVNVTPGPMGYAPSGAAAFGSGIAASMALRQRGAGAASDDVAFGPEVLLAQATNQSSVRVEAAVSPDPTATLLYTNNQTVIMNGVAGTTVTQACAYTVTVNTTQKSWTLYHGLSNDFSGSTFPGNDLLNNSYVSTPNAKATPFVVYPDNSNQFAILSKSGGNATFCVDLTLNLPANVPGGAYSSNAIYTLYY
ncbi:MAG TPA: hypothetical protein VIG51_02645 [Candidatus Baltobacteraceae bacterium]|jgi:hypothetical protein